MVKRKSKKSHTKPAKGEAEVSITQGNTPAVPPADNPQLRHEAESFGIDDATAAALRVEAIRRTRAMNSSDEPPDK